ncbi:hypothetical protein QYS49_35790 [Marivirga salinae]|uniref:Fibronectin type-III domain-containing protein n=1 Tax=Marivirga salinarum TaxID=3059078 RepID=A0AA51N8Y8_9BACT|nr:hypothetical protein [Marivirga sp. BDSF4-3]WMN10733.1 hypothetical protein QYS49_35790 [Marivirga sp. BDSF4-3]
MQVTSNLIPPYSLYLSDYSDANQSKWNIQLLLKDFTQTNYQAKLRITIEGAGIRLRTRQGYSPGPIRLEPGLPYKLDETDLSNYLNIQNMEVSGINRNQLASTQKLPEGFYQFKIEVLDYNRNNRVSNIGTSMAWLVLNDPPLLNFPFEEKLRLQDPQQVQFQWTPRHTSSPNSAFETEYVFRLWEIWPEGRNPNEVARTTQPLFETTIMTTSYFYGLNDAMLIPGRSYAWQVQAINLNGRDLFKNQGKSEVRWFKYGDECLPITNLGAEALGTDRIRISWEGGWNHNQYVAQIRETGTEEWINYGTNIETQVVYDLKANTEYHIRVLPSCGAIEGTAENTLTLSTPEQNVEDFDCGAEPDLPIIENREPIAQLNPGDRITAAGFSVILTEVIKTGDIYNGMGLIEVPLFNSARVEAMLNDIQVNTDKQLIGGNVESTLNPNGPFILDLDTEDELSEEGGEENNDEEEETEDLPETDIDIDGEIADVAYDEEGGTITVTDTEGNTTEIDTETSDENEDGDIVIEDEEGNVWVVGDDGEVSGPHNSGGETGGEEYAQDSLIVQEELIKEVLVYYKEEINLWIDNYEKGPLDESTINRLSDFPDCLPEDIDRLDAILIKINEYIEDPDSLLELIQEDDLRRTKIENFVSKLSGTQPPYASGLSDEEWDELIEMMCVFLIEEEEVNYEGFVATVDGDTLKTDEVYIVNTSQIEFNLTFWSKIEDTKEVSYKVSLEEEGDTTKVSYSTDEDDEVITNKTWTLILKPVKEGKYTITHKLHESDEVKYEFWVRHQNHEFACKVCGRDLKMTHEKLKKLFPSSSTVKNNTVINDYFKLAVEKAELNTCYRQAHFFSQIAHESNGMKATSEGTNYSLERMLEVWKWNSNSKTVFYKQSFWDEEDYLDYASIRLYMKMVGTETDVSKYKSSSNQTYNWGNKENNKVTIKTEFSKNDEGEFKREILSSSQKKANGKRLLNLVYSNGVGHGNGDVASGDGYKYRGRGAIQLTGKANYKAISDKCNSLFGTNYDWVSNPDEVKDSLKATVLSASAFIINRLGSISKLDTECTSENEYDKCVRPVTKLVNGGSVGLADRKEKFKEMIEGMYNNCKPKKE